MAAFRSHPCSHLRSRRASCSAVPRRLFGIGLSLGFLHDLAQEEAAGLLGLLAAGGNLGDRPPAFSARTWSRMRSNSPASLFWIRFSSCARASGFLPVSTIAARIVLPAEALIVPASIILARSRHAVRLQSQARQIAAPLVGQLEAHLRQQVADPLGIGRRPSPPARRNRPSSGPRSGRPRRSRSGRTPARSGPASAQGARTAGSESRPATARVGVTGTRSGSGK